MSDLAPPQPLPFSNGDRFALVKALSESGFLGQVFLDGESVVEMLEMVEHYIMGGE